jgi:hypothetical protein
MAVLGKKSQPTSQPCCLYQSFAFFSDQAFDCALVANEKVKSKNAVSVLFILSF